MVSLEFIKNPPPIHIVPQHENHIHSYLRSPKTIQYIPIYYITQLLVTYSRLYQIASRTHTLDNCYNIGLNESQM